MISRRGFFRAATALALATPSIRAMAARQALTQADLLQFQPLGEVTLLHLTDLHAQLRPIHFREPSVNIGIGEAKGRPPHLTDAALRAAYGIPAGSPDAYALTSDDFVALAKDYGRMGGLDRIATLVKAIRAERGNDRVLLLDGGDTWHGSWTALQTKGADMVRCMGLLKPDAMVGHFEFTLGQDRVKELADGLGFPFLAGNVTDEWKELVFPAMTMAERGGVKIAVIGQAFPFTPVANPRWMVPDWAFGIQEEMVRQHVGKARADGAQLVVLLSHNGYDVDRKMAGRVEGIDVILSGHTHDALPKPEVVGTTLLAASGCYGKFLTRIDVSVTNGRMSGWRHRLIPVFSDAITPDAEMAQAIAEVRAPYEAELGRELGRSETLLFRRGNVNGTFDDLICQAMLEQRDAEIALSPGFRWGPTVLPGEAIDAEAVYASTAITYPECYRSTMSGARLHEVMEDVADNLFNPDPYYQQGGDMVRLGGLSYVFEPTAPMGRRIRDMTLLRTGKPIDPAHDYVIAGWASINQGTQGPPIWQVVENWLKDHRTVRLNTAETVKIVGA
ncbi:MAG: thiosulfohydrolase SoxB [Acetobacteraceae bacterium]